MPKPPKPRAANGTRGRFLVPAGIYCCSHSLGLEPAATAGYVAEALETWGQRAVEGHFLGAPPWAAYAQPLEAMSARLVGATPPEVAVMNSLTVNLHLMLASFYRPRGARRKILMERPAFPSDRYAVVSHLQGHGIDPAEALVQVDGPELEAAAARLGGELALMLAGGVNYYTGEAVDLERCARAAHAAGACVGFDLAHAIGNVAVDLRRSGADFAVWCGYKYLCGGPGAPGGCFVHERHWTGARALPRLAGWWGNRADTRFEMRDSFEPAPGAAGWQVSCPSILALAALRAGLEEYDRTPGWRARREALSAAAAQGLAELAPAVKVVTPARRGAQVSLELGPNAAAVQQRLRAAGVFSDVRGTILRLSFHPLYNRRQDVAGALRALAAAVNQG